MTNADMRTGKWLFSKLYDLKFTITVSKFDRDMNKIKEVVLENGEKNFGPLIPKLTSFNNKLYVSYFKAADKASFNVYLAALDDNLTLGEPKLICTIKQDNVGVMQVQSVFEAGLVYFVISPDNARLLAVCKAAPNKVQTILLDDKLQTIKQNLISVNFPSFDIPSAVLTDDNRACLILKTDEETRLLCIGPDGEKTEIRYNGGANFFPYETRAKLAKDGKSIFIYSTTKATEEWWNTWCNGFMVARLDPATFKLSKPLTYALTPEFIKAVSEKGGGTKHKNDYLMSNFTPQMLELDNGDIAIVGSSERTESDVSRSAPNMNNQTHFTATTTMTVGPVVVLFPDKKGKTYDQVIIPREIIISKSQSSGSGAIKVVQAPQQSDVTAGFLATHLGQDIVIIYNDNVKNLSKEVDEKMTVSKSAGDLELAEALVNNDKKLEYRKLISETNKGRATFYLGNAIPTINSSTIVFPIGKEGQGFSAMKTYYTNWCFLDIK